MDGERRQKLIRLIQFWMLGASQLMQLLMAALLLYNSPSYWSQPYHTSKLSGYDWVQELITGHPDRIHCELGVRLHVFLRLLCELRVLGYGDSKYVSLEEQLAIFLYSCVTGLSCRHVGERFQRSNETITVYFKKMLLVFAGDVFYNTYVQLPLANSPVSDYIRLNPKLYPYFKDCLGALDGTHIVCSPSAADRSNMRNRKGGLSQNVLAGSSFCLRFLYILAGWEGSVNDSFLYADARLHDLRVPAGRYYLGDAGFPLCPQLLTPYRSTRYHLREWALGNQKPRNKKELFNLRHAQARNVIERIFGVVKKRWQILVVPPHYDMDMQAKVPVALAALHNFILEHDPMEELPEDIIDPVPGFREAQQADRGALAPGHLTDEDSNEGDAMRERIANAMWADYCRILEERGEDDPMLM